jgi:signal transduction histidine kinase
VDRLIEFFEPMAISHAIALQRIVGVDPLVCPVDEKLLSQALLNLVLNAKEAMPKGGTLTFETGQTGDWAVVSVTDTGIGIAPEDRERIFKPFFSNKASGTGLGLSLTRRIVQEHGGTLGVTSAVGQGTTFALRLPLRPGAAVANG